LAVKNSFNFGDFSNIESKCCCPDIISSHFLTVVNNADSTKTTTVGKTVKIVSSALARVADGTRYDGITYADGNGAVGLKNGVSTE
jgi:hypothetical protein